MPNDFPPTRLPRHRRGSGPGPSDPRVLAQISDGLRLPIGDASSVVRRYPTTLTDEPMTTAQIMRGAAVGGRGRSTADTSAAALPRDFDGWPLPGWAWSDVLPHFLAIETDLDFAGPLHGVQRPDPVRRPHEMMACTEHSSSGSRTPGYPGSPISMARRRDAVAAGSRCCSAEHRRRHPGRPGRAISATGDGATESDIAGADTGRRIRMSAGRAVGVDASGPTGGRSDCGPNRIVCRSDRIGTPADAVRHRRRGDAARGRRTGVVRPPVGMACVDHPEWVIPDDWTATHDCPRWKRC